MALCGEQVGGGVVSFGCDLSRDHDGPCRAIENPRSVRDREKWEVSRSHDESGLSAFQGPPTASPEGLLTPESELTYPTEISPEAEAQMRPSIVEETDDGGIIFETIQDSFEEDESEATAPTKTRPGDQPLPEETDGAFVQERIIDKIETLREQGVLPDPAADHLIASMEESMEVGRERYGTPLQTFNGRDALKDALDEARDLYVYLSSMEQAREATREEWVAAVERALMQMLSGREDAPTVDVVAETAVDAILKAIG